MLQKWLSCPKTTCVFPHYQWWQWCACWRWFSWFSYELGPKIPTNEDSNWSEVHEKCIAQCRHPSIILGQRFAILAICCHLWACVHVEIWNVLRSASLNTSPGKSSAKITTFPMMLMNSNCQFIWQSDYKCELDRLRLSSDQCRTNVSNNPSVDDRETYWIHWDSTVQVAGHPDRLCKAVLSRKDHQDGLA